MRATPGLRARERFEDYARHWLDTYKGRTIRGVGDRTMGGYRRCLERYAIPYFRGYKLADVESPDVREFVTHLERKRLRASTIRGVLAPVRAMFATAVEDGAVRYNPATGVRIAGRRDAPPAREIRGLTRPELARLLAEVPDEWRPFFEFLGHTGLRISEAIGLTWADVEFGDHPRVLVRRQDCRGVIGELKSDYSRRDIPLSPGMARRLWAARRGRRASSRVFTTPGGAPISDGNLRRRVLEPARKRAGLPWVTFHSFRHTCASLLFEAGRDVKQVQEWLGHSDPGFTLRTYVHLLDAGVGDANFFDAAVSEGWQRVATQHPETTANAEAVDATVSVLQSREAS